MKYVVYTCFSPTKDGLIHSQGNTFSDYEPALKFAQEYLKWSPKVTVYIFEHYVSVRANVDFDISRPD